MVARPVRADDEQEGGKIGRSRRSAAPSSTRLRRRSTDCCCRPDRPPMTVPAQPSTVPRFTLLQSLSITLQHHQRAENGDDRQREEGNAVDAEP